MRCLQRFSTVTFPCLSRSRVGFATVYFLLYLFLGAVLFANPAGVDEDGWRLSLPGWEYQFPRDHSYHSDFKTEWWYFTGNLRSLDGKEEFGYQLTFFRQGIQPRELQTASRFAVRDLPFAHFAVSHFSRDRYHHFSRWNRGAFGEAGFGGNEKETPLAWIKNWKVELAGPGVFRLQAREGGVEIDLELVTEKPPVFHGSDGISRKAAGEGRASHYYSFTRLRTSGTIQVDGRTHAVEGLSWYDHEWATNQLTEEQSGWDWFSLQFEDGTELMLFQIRLHEGGRDPFSSGTWVDAEGNSRSIGIEDFSLEPLDHWLSQHTEARYPIRWRLAVPKLELDLEITARMRSQEFVEPPVVYWEGAVLARGKREGKNLSGSGYLEMTGYGGPVVGMQATGPASGR